MSFRLKGRVVTALFDVFLIFARGLVDLALAGEAQQDGQKDIRPG